MENHFDKRLNPTLLVDGQSVVLAIELLPEQLQNSDTLYQNMLMVITIL
jgi:hypothetical protein